VVTAAGIGAVTLSEPLEATLGEQFARAQASVQLPSALPRTGGPGRLGILLFFAIGLAATAGGAYLRRRTPVATAR
jgi:hypothetical protein